MCFLTVSSRPCLETSPHSILRTPFAGHCLGGLRGGKPCPAELSEGGKPCLSNPVWRHSPPDSAGHCLDTHGSGAPKLPKESVASSPQPGEEARAACLGRDRSQKRTPKERRNKDEVNLRKGGKTPSPRKGSRFRTPPPPPSSNCPLSRERPVTIGSEVLKLSCSVPSLLEREKPFTLSSGKRLAGVGA